MNINMEKQEIGKFYATSFNDIVIEFIVFDDNTIDCPTLGLQDYNSIELKPKFELHGHKIDKDGNFYDFKSYTYEVKPKEKFKIPEGTQTGTKFTIKNRGFKSINGKWRGDFVFTVIVQVPKRLTHEQRELLVELAKTMNEQPPLKKKGIFG